jgi:hypothetical protein
VKQSGAVVAAGGRLPKEATRGFEIAPQDIPGDAPMRQGKERVGIASCGGGEQETRGFLVPPGCSQDLDARNL